MRGLTERKDGKMNITQEVLDVALEQVRQNNWDTANMILGGFGTEQVKCCGAILEYINLGDTYTLTICQEINPAGEPFIGSWGQWYEDTENEYCETENVIRCGYCSEFTPMNKSDWRDVVCESCGNLVGG